jgi:membrane-associated phospholipid phosphatase
MHIHNSFPSGHATQGFAILFCLALGARSQFLKMALLLLAILTSFSRVYLSQHFMADIAAGSLVGLIAAVSYYYFIIQRNRMRPLDKPLTAMRRT